MGKIYNRDRHDNITFSTEEGEWLCMAVDDSQHKIVTGRNKHGLYQMNISKQFDHWEDRVMDFIGYIEAGDANGILFITDKDLNQAKKHYKYAYNGDLRHYEPETLIHSTLKSSWDSIESKGCLMSWSALKTECLLEENQPIGRLLGDPSSLSHYVMLGTGLSSEIVVASKQKQELCCDEHGVYEPGVRLYFDAKKIAEDGLLIRDGAHLKVKNQLMLESYLVAKVTADMLEDIEWTPNLFSKHADQYVKENLNGKVLARE